MIFLTVGHQTPFDRLVEAVDAWASEHRDVDFFAQIGEGRYLPRHMPYKRWLSSAEFDEALGETEAVVSHAGTGTIIQVLMSNKPLLVLPRRAELKETRNNHQLGTARYFADRGLVLAVDDAAALGEALQQLPEWQPADSIRSVASPGLIERVRTFIET